MTFKKRVFGGMGAFILVFAVVGFIVYADSYDWVRPIPEVPGNESLRVGNMTGNCTNETFVKGFNNVTGEKNCATPSGNITDCSQVNNCVDTGTAEAWVLAAENVTPGTFDDGNYTFPNDVNVSENIYLQPNQRVYLNGSGSFNLYVESDGENVSIVGLGGSFVINATGIESVSNGGSYFYVQ